MRIAERGRRGRTLGDNGGGGVRASWGMQGGRTGGKVGVYVWGCGMGTWGGGYVERGGGCNVGGQGVVE